MSIDISNLEDAEKLFNELKLEEESLEKEISQLLKESRVFDSKMKNLKKQMPKTDLIKSDTEELLKDLNFNGDLAKSVSSKVRKMDTVKNRVSECLQRVGDISDLKSCTAGIQVALDNEEYENAALIVQRFLKLNEIEMKKSAPTDDDGSNRFKGSNVLTASSMDEAFAKLHDAESKLKQLVLKKFDEAVSCGDVASVERFFKLFPFLNQEKEGLRKFANYLSTKIGDQSLNRPKVSQNNQAVYETHTEQLGKLFQTIAQIIDVHQPLVETYYKHGNLLYVIEFLQKECDRRVRRIFEDFKNKRNFSQLISLIQKAMKSQNNPWSTSSSTPRIDPIELDVLLTEIILVNSRCETYLKFVRRRVTEDDSVAYPDEKSPERIQSNQRLEHFMRSCDLSRLMQDLNGHYVLIEEYFLHETASKAIEMDEENPEGLLTSNMLDDVFFIIKKCIKRANSGGNMDVLCAIINHSITLLDTTYFDALNERIRYGFPNSIASAAAALDLSQAYNALQSGRYLQNSSDFEKTKKLFVTGVNNLDKSCQYLKTLRNFIKDEVSKTGNISLDGSQNDKLESCLSEMTSLTGKFKSSVIYALTQMNLSLLKPSIKLWVESLTSSDNNLSDEDMVTVETTEGLRPFTQTFLVTVDATLTSLKPQLTPNNYDTLIGIFSSEVTTRFESAVLKCSFNKVRVVS